MQFLSPPILHTGREVATTTIIINQEEKKRENRELWRFLAFVLLLGLRLYNQKIFGQKLIDC